MIKDKIRQIPNINFIRNQLDLRYLELQKVFCLVVCQEVHVNKGRRPFSPGCLRSSVP